MKVLDKVINKEKLVTVIRNHIVSFVACYLLTLWAYLYSGFEIFNNPFWVVKFTKMYSVDLSLSLLILMFPCFFAHLAYKIYNILSKEYIQVYEGFIEGPTSMGERIVLSMNQVKAIGLNYFGEFSIFSTTDDVITLPGKIDWSKERELSRQIKRYLKNSF